MTNKANKPVLALAGCFGLIVLSCGGCLTVSAIVQSLADPEIVAEFEKNSARRDAELTTRQAELDRINQERPKMDLDRYDQCKSGMTFEEVITIVGRPSSEMASSSVGGIDTVIYEWRAGILANANMTFQNNRLVSKAKIGF
jgi:hypothetical protein